MRTISACCLSDSLKLSVEVEDVIAGAHVSRCDYEGWTGCRNIALMVLLWERCARRVLIAHAIGKVRQFYLAFAYPARDGAPRSTSKEEIFVGRAFVKKQMRPGPATQAALLSRTFLLR